MALVRKSYQEVGGERKVSVGRSEDSLGSLGDKRAPCRAGGTSRKKQRKFKEGRASPWVAFEEGPKKKRTKGEKSFTFKGSGVQKLREEMGVKYLFMRQDLVLETASNAVGGWGMGECEGISLSRGNTGKKTNQSLGDWTECQVEVDGISSIGREKWT